MTSSSASAVSSSSRISTSARLGPADRHPTLLLDGASDVRAASAAPDRCDLLAVPAAEDPAEDRHDRPGHAGAKCGQLLRGGAVLHPGEEHPGRRRPTAATK